MLLSIRSHERDRHTLGTETTGTTDAVHVGVGISGEVVVDHDVDVLDVDTAGAQVGRDEDAGVVRLEVVEHLGTAAAATVAVLSLDLPVEGSGREGGFAEHGVQFVSAVGGVNEDDHLVELDIVEDLDKLAVLLVLGERGVVLLESVKDELVLLADERDDEGILHEHGARLRGFLGEGGGKHHDLLFLRGLEEERLHLVAHVAAAGGEDLVTLVDDEVLDVRQVQERSSVAWVGLGQIEEAPGGADDDVRGLVSLQELDVVLLALT